MPTICVDFGVIAAAFAGMMCCLKFSRQTYQEQDKKRPSLFINERVEYYRVISQPMVTLHLPDATTPLLPLNKL
jgi:hypothetical protein